ncbi:MAG TPA: hypothetical protein VGG64_21630 [Pirellulales bacterium]
MRTKNARYLKWRSTAPAIAIMASLAYAAPAMGFGVEPTAEKSADWPEGARVAGRVVDHQGIPIANAEVLLLGEERIFVDGENLSWFVLTTANGRPPKPLSTRTTVKGEFLIDREKGPANRLAVIAESPILWVVSRSSLPQLDNIEIKLPPPGNLAINCDLPGKPAEQGVMIELRSFDGIVWNTDAVRFHFSNCLIKNPGETMFEGLPPGRYAVQRNQMLETGERTMLINLSDRQLVTVESNKRATVRFSREAGRPMSGKVRGLEDLKLGHAHVTINYFGPEEEPGRDGKRLRYGTVFEAIPINADGAFTTDPIPPGDYWIDLFAVRAKAAKETDGRSDFSAQKRFTVPDNGEMTVLELVAKPESGR